jgi:hypothetical protein
MLAGSEQSSPVQDREVITLGDDYENWTELNNDTTGFEREKTHVLGRESLEWDKVDSSANTKFAGVYRADAAFNFSRFLHDDVIVGLFYVSATTNVANAILRLGTSSAHYNEWKLADSGITGAQWQEFKKKLSECEMTVQGDGWDPSNVQYVAFMIEFDAESDTLADIRLDHLMVKSVQPAS